ncbi:hypothetical protein I4F81_001719 [Pyropia yezoensis]|uniref:Uncharacterized protein n=1 Tax=Pyropia yezoensis TaxID=2788 RepID=A0ACC3BNP2_PYRYE|nr:hypothetical protein I4F81_001719 [Neopyropia yezoensis]
MEWGTVLLGYEQANRYTLRAAPDGAIAGYIAEEDSLGKSLLRNVARTHRSFTAMILDAAGTPVVRLRRPFYLMSTSMFVEEPDGRPLGEVHMTWHPLRRRYALHGPDGEQFAAVDSPWLAVDFDAVGRNGGVLANVGKDWTGLVRELFSDARQYVVRFGAKAGEADRLEAGGACSDPAAQSALDAVARVAAAAPAAPPLPVGAGGGGVTPGGPPLAGGAAPAVTAAAASPSAGGSLPPAAAAPSAAAAVPADAATVAGDAPAAPDVVAPSALTREQRAVVLAAAPGFAPPGDEFAPDDGWAGEEGWANDDGWAADDDGGGDDDEGGGITGLVGDLWDSFSED